MALAVPGVYKSNLTLGGCSSRGKAARGRYFCVVIDFPVRNVPVLTGGCRERAPVQRIGRRAVPGAGGGAAGSGQTSALANNAR